MIAVVQRVTEATVQVGSDIAGAIGPGLVVLAAICADDSSADVDWMARKLTEFRTFRQGEKHFELDVKQVGGSILLVSNFTVAAATGHGRRPSFHCAAPAAKGAELFDDLTEAVSALGVPVQTGRFGADMRVHLINDGPVTVILNSRENIAVSR